VILNPESGPLREAAGEAVHAAIGELNHEAATGTHDVVSVDFLDPGVVPVAMLHVDGPYQVQARQELHRAIDAGQADPGGYAAGAPMHLGHPEMPRGRPQDLEDGLAGLGQLEPPAAERLGHGRSSHGQFPIEKISPLLLPLKLQVVKVAANSVCCHLAARPQGRGADGANNERHAQFENCPSVTIPP
jgi:hypothetical protein